MIDCKAVADAANMIINGYAYTKDRENVKVLNLNNPDRAIVLDRDGEVLETSMCDIEIQIVKDYLAKNIEFMED